MCDLGIIVSIYIIVVQGETVGPRVTVIRVKDNEVDYLLTNLALQLTMTLRQTAKTPSIRGLFQSIGRGCDAQ